MGRGFCGPDIKLLTAKFAKKGRKVREEVRQEEHRPRVTWDEKNCNIQSLGRDVVCGLACAMGLSSTTLISGFARTTRMALSLLVHAQSAFAASLILATRHSRRQTGVYNILWAFVFGFATLNILSLAARRFEPNRRGLTFGELLAVVVVLLSIFLLAWELLGVFHVFPIKLHR
jgi:hypothetical protein